MLNGIFHTDGSGLWGAEAGTVKVTGVVVRDFKADNPELWADEDDIGELRVMFDPECAPDGLIYTDNLFEDEIRAAFDALGIPGKAIDYSEMGMQGERFVSFDVGPEFIRAWRKK